MSKTADQIRSELDAKIPRDAIALREGGNGKSLSYLQGWYVINRLNEVFGQGNWSYSTKEMRLVHQGTLPDKYKNTVNVAHYVAQVELAVRLPCKRDPSLLMETRFSDFGYGDGSDKVNPGKAHELAVKEAVTDAIKRCAKNLGMSMGLALYDKSQENVDDGQDDAPSTPAAKPAPKPRAVAQGPKPEARKDASVAATISSGPEQKSVPENPPTERGQLNEMITQMSKVIIAKKKNTQEELRAMLKEKFGVDRKEDLTDARAADLYAHLKGIV